ncbi:hypothetical protein VNI00_011346 [Paramarasmius palmivorus]|uniref:Arrestin-like N-terminal domain-containing protein n=1 Tax=Paramarasmius palmivorus TaxID=297713 RepID=A0AAW0CCP8_9AGAR
MDIMDPPPSYQVEHHDSIPAPEYSDIPRASDITLPSDPHEFISSPHCKSFNWKYKSSHMTIDFGPRIWGLHTPAYGLGGVIQFSVEVNGVECRADQITATLEGMLFSPTTKTVTFLHQEIPQEELSLHRRNSFPQREVKDFSVQIPSAVELNGSSTPTPPSFLRYYYGVSCEIKYQVKIRIALPHRPWSGDETKIIPIAYLPKSRPLQPPVTKIPRPLQEADGNILCPEFDSSDHTTTVKLSPSFARSDACCAEFNDAVFFSLPSPATFTSGQKIPYLFSLVFPSHPHLSALYAHFAIKVTLVKQLILHPHQKKKHHTHHSFSKAISRSRSPSPESHPPQPVKLENKVACGRPKYQSEYKEGVYILRGWVDAGEVGKESSWKLGGVASQQYVLRVSIHPPDHLLDNLPTFEHECAVEIMTDECDSLQRELHSMGGIPTPALGLARGLISESEVDYL